MSQIVLGKVAFVDKGVYATASTYNTFDFVVTDDSCYLCVKDGNKNHPLTDTAWWPVKPPMMPLPPQSMLRP